MESGGKRKYLVFFCKLLAGTIKETFPITKKPQRFRGGFRGFRQVGRYRPPDKISKRQARAHPWSCPGRGLFLKGFSAPRRPRPRLPAFLEPWKHVFFQKKKTCFFTRFWKSILYGVSIQNAKKNTHFCSRKIHIFGGRKKQLFGVRQKRAIHHLRKMDWICRAVAELNGGRKLSFQIESDPVADSDPPGGTPGATFFFFVKKKTFFVKF